MGLGLGPLDDIWTIVIIVVLTVLVVILLSVVIWVCVSQKKKAKKSLEETVNDNPYYEGFEATVYKTNNSNVVDNNDYYQHNCD